MAVWLAHQFHGGRSRVIRRATTPKRPAPLVKAWT
jgi:hypothetical protein